MTPGELTSAREDLGLSQSALARVLDVARDTIIRWEDGESRIPLTLDLALMTIRRNREEMAGNHYPLVADVLRVMRENGVDQETAIRAFGVEP